jgi:hypothetical protein
VEHVAGVEDYQVAPATYRRAACERWPGTPITLRQGARVWSALFVGGGGRLPVTFFRARWGARMVLVGSPESDGAHFFQFTSLVSLMSSL